MAAEEGVGGFLTRNRTAIIATVVAGASVVSAYYYYKQMRDEYNYENDSVNSADGEESKNETKKNSKKKKKKKNSKKKNGAPDGVSGSIATSELPDISQKDTWTPEEREQNAMLFKNKGNEFFSIKKYTEAVEYYTKALEIHEHPVFYANRSACWAPLNELDKVIEDTTAALKLKPDYSKCLLRRASVNEAKGNFDDAMLDLSAISLFGEYGTQSFEPALERNMNKQAIKVLQKKLAEGEKHQLPSDTSLAAFFTVFPIEDSVPHYDETSEGDRVLLQGLKALHERNWGSYNKADEFFSKAAELLSDEYKKVQDEGADLTTLKEKFAMALEYVGIFTFLKNEPLDANKKLLKAIELFPRTNSYIYMALIMADKGDAGEYMQYFEKAIKLDPGCSAIYYHRGQMNFVTQKYEEAAQDFDKAKECDPQKIFPYIQLACLAYKRDNFDECETLFSEARRKFPTAPEVPNFFGEILGDRGDFDTSIKEYEIARKLEAAQEGIHVGVAPLVGKATVLSKRPSMENFIEATSLFEEACRVDPRSEQAKIGLAQLKLQQEEVDEAIALFEEAADLSRSFEEKLQATTFAEAAKIQKRIKADPLMNAKIQESLEKYRNAMAM